MAELAQAVSLSGSGNTLQPWWKRAQVWRVAVLIALSLWLYGHILARLVTQWWSDPNFSHGFFVPVFAAFMAWQERSRLRSVSSEPSNWGLPIILLALSTLVVGVFGAELFLSRFSLVLLVVGIIVLLKGWGVLRVLLFPLLFLLLMVPLPAIIFSQITFPLQILASKLSAWVLPALGVPVLREGNVINLPAMPLEVAEACSGIRSLLSLTTLAIMYGYLMEKRIGIRVLLALASIPIAVAANGLRIVGTGLLVQYWDPDKAEGFFHAFSGWLIFVVSLLFLFLFHRAVNFFGRGREVPA
jgi:exosortase